MYGLFTTKTKICILKRKYKMTDLTDDVKEIAEDALFEIKLIEVLK